MNNDIKIYEGIPVKMIPNYSNNKSTLELSIKNILKTENKQFLNILITNINQLQLIGECYTFCKIGITGITLEQKKLLAQYYSNRLLIVDEKINNSYIDIIICNNNELLKKLISNNYIKYIYTIDTQNLNLNYYKKYISNIQNSYFYINRLNVNTYQQIYLNNNQNNQDFYVIQNILKKKNNNNNNKIANDIIKNQKVITNNITNTIAIILPYYNNQITTCKLLKTLQWYSNNKKYKITVILISDGSKQEISLNIIDKCKKYKNIKLEFIFNDNRCGYIKSVNKGIKKALQDNFNFIVLMHNDIQVSYNWLQLIDNIKDNTVCTCPITNSIYDKYQNIKYIRNNNILQNFPQSFQKCKTLTINEKLEIYKNKNIKLNQNFFIPNFFCIAFHANVFKQFGLLNEKYNQGFGENIELIKKIFNSNYNIQFMPSIYIPHIGRNTFKDLYDLKQFNIQAEARQYINNIAINLNFNKKKYKVIYTCITNNYDCLKHTVYNQEEFDYIFFGQNNDNIEQPWKFIDINPLKQVIGTDNPIKVARFFKTHPHLFFKNYEQSLWIDGNIDIITDPNNIFEIFLQDQHMLISNHPQRNSIYSQAQVCKVMNKDTKQNIDRLLEYFNKEGFKDQSGLVQSGLILRRHKNIECIKLMEFWWNIIKKYSCRDQLSFSFCIQKLNINVLRISWNIFNNKYIKWNGIHGK